MNKKGIASVIALVVVAGVTAVLLIPRSVSTYHLEAEYPQGEKKPAYLWLTDIQDCNLEVSFVDDLNLLYEVNVALYESVPASSAFEFTVNDYRTSSGWMDVKLNGIKSIKVLQVTLGSGVPYYLVVTGTDVNATFIYDNSAVGSGASIDYSATGSFVNLTFGETMTFSSFGMDVSIAGEPDYAYLYVNLPDGVNGAATIKEPLSIHSNTGWVFRSQFVDTVTYSTDPVNPEPLLGIGIWTKYGVHAWLSD